MDEGWKMDFLKQDKDVRELMVFLTSIANAGAPDRVVKSVLRAGLKKLAAKAEKQIGHRLPRRVLDHHRGDHRLN